MSLSAEFNWTPGQIRRLTLQELVHYLDRLGEWREKVKRTDIAINEIRMILMAFFGAKEQEPDEDPVAKMSGKIPTASVPSGAIEAWERAGRPEPRAFFKKYKANHG